MDERDAPAVVDLRDDLGASAAAGALAFTVFSVTMTLGRIFGEELPSGLVLVNSQ